jgi:radical SAM superfamily enzyme YgiQ (UPF0313 family)
LLLYLINPSNPLISLANVEKSRWNRYRVWKPLSLLVLAGLTPREWKVQIIDENREVPDYSSLPHPDLVGITAFTSQAPRAYRLAAEFRRREVPVVMGGIHASMCPEEALERVDTVVAGEAEDVWGALLEDAKRGSLKRVYPGIRPDLERVPPTPQDLLSSGYSLGSIQTSRGCPLRCSFCSVPAFHGRSYRFRPIATVIQEFKWIREKYVLIVDDNLIGVHRDHLERAKDLFKALIRADLRKRWIAQVTANVGEDEELLRLAARCGCVGFFVGFESGSPEGLGEIDKNFNLLHARDLKTRIRRIQRHGIGVAGSFMLGLDTDRKGAGRRLAELAGDLGLDILNVLILTPLPGTPLWQRMEGEGRIAVNHFPEDWKYYTLLFPVLKCENLSGDDLIQEINSCNGDFYSYRRILYRMGLSLYQRRLMPFLVSTLSCRSNLEEHRRICRELGFAGNLGGRPGPAPSPVTGNPDDEI